LSDGNYEKLANGMLIVYSIFKHEKWVIKQHQKIIKLLKTDLKHCKLVQNITVKNIVEILKDMELPFFLEFFSHLKKLKSFKEIVHIIQDEVSKFSLSVSKALSYKNPLEQFHSYLK